jgi:hypothetical protein
MPASQPRLQRLIYRSRQAASVVNDLEFEVGNIVRSSIRNNRMVNLSGLLVTIQGWFVQVLEGAPDQLEATYQRIAADTRHLEPEVISFEAIARREFRDWDMCARDLSPSDAVIVENLDKRSHFEPGRLTAKSSLRLLSGVAQIQRQAARAMAV